MMRLIKNNVISGIPLLHREAGEVGGAFFFKTRSSEGVRAVLRAKKPLALFHILTPQTRRTPSALSGHLPRLREGGVAKVNSGIIKS